MENKKTYTYDEAFNASLQYFAGDELAARVWVNKYAMKDSFGNIYESSPEDMHWRIAREIARIEKKYANPMTEQEVFNLLDHFRYIVPAGSPMTGIGNSHQVASLSNCFVIGVEGDGDSYGAIMRLDEEQVQLMKRRGGVGHDLSQIRPKGSPVNNSALTSTGLVPFMERYSNSTREVAQDGRRGALMLSVSIKHPESEAFIDAKMTEGKVTGANVSVKIDDEFMQAVVDDKPYTQKFPIDSDKPLMSQEISAKQLWKKIVHNAWKSAEPGVLFWDTILRESIPDCYADLGFRTVSTNPCGEIPLCPYDSCRLLSFVDEVGDSFEEYIVYHKKFLEWMRINGIDTDKRYTQEEIDQLVARSPYYKATANDVDWLMKVRMQGAIQKWVDHSISVTVNLPNDVDEDLVDRLYVEAWRSGCKGCTIYRDGSRSGVLVSASKKDKKKTSAPAVKEKHVVQVDGRVVTETRPKELECDVVRFQNNKEKWVAFIGLLDGYPYEIFTGLQDDEEGIALPKTVTKGRIIKQTGPDGKKRYDFQFENKRGYKTTVEGLSEKFNPEYWNYAKLISGVLRYRMPIDHVIKLVGSLQLKDESINTWKNGVERALKKYVVDGTEVKGQVCPVCGQETLVYQEGCLICKNCGTSRCG